MRVWAGWQTSPSRERRRTFSRLGPLDNSTDQGVIFGIGLTHIDAGEHERRDNDEEADRNADGRYTCPQRDAEEFRRIRDQQNEAEIDDEHNQRQRPSEGRASPHQLLVVRIPLDRFVAFRIHPVPPGKSQTSTPTKWSDKINQRATPTACCAHLAKRL